MALSLWLSLVASIANPCCKVAVEQTQLTMMSAVREGHVRIADIFKGHGLS